MLFFGGFHLFLGKRTCYFAFVSLCYGRSGEEICMGYAMAASSPMQYDYKQTNQPGADPTRAKNLNAYGCSHGGSNDKPIK
jgi:hypothetical protein